MQEHEHEFSFKDLFVPFTTLKAILWIATIGFIVFFNMLFNKFVWDDLAYIINNPGVYTFNVVKSFEPNLFNSSGYYRPLSALYAELLYSIFNNSYFFYHFLQLVFHIVDTILIFLLFKRFFSRKLSLILSLIFLVHPIQVESVSFIASSDSTIFFFFGMLALLLSLKEKLERRRLLIIGILLLLSILTKETGILFLLIILLCRMLFRKGYLQALSICEIVVAGTYILIRFFIGKVYVTHVNSPTIPIGTLSFAGRMITVPKIIYYYISTFVFPKDLSIDQLWTVSKITIAEFYLPVMVVILCGILVGLFTILLFKKTKKNFIIYIFFLFWFLGGLLMVLQIFPLDMTVADRWFYFPIVGLLGMIGVVIQSLMPSNERMRIIVYACMISIIVFLSIRTIMRNTNWYDGISLFSHDSSIHTNFDLENNLSTEYSKNQEYTDALKHSKISVALFPYEINLFNLAVVYEHLGQLETAKEYYYKALMSKHYIPISQKHLVFTHEGLSWLLLYEKSYTEAQIIIHDGLAEYPNEAQLWEDLAICDYGLHNREQALTAVNKAIYLSPNNEEYQGLLLQLQKGNPIQINLFPIGPHS